MSAKSSNVLQQNRSFLKESMLSMLITLIVVISILNIFADIFTFSKLMLPTSMHTLWSFTDSKQYIDASYNIYPLNIHNPYSFSPINRMAVNLCALYNEVLKDKFIQSIPRIFIYNEKLSEKRVSYVYDAGLNSYIKFYNRDPQCLNFIQNVDNGLFDHVMSSYQFFKISYYSTEVNNKIVTAYINQFKFGDRDHNNFKVSLCRQIMAFIKTCMLNKQELAQILSNEILQTRLNYITEVFSSIILYRQ